MRKSPGCELTGDTAHFGKSAWGDARNASIMYVQRILMFLSTHEHIPLQHYHGELRFIFLKVNHRKLMIIRDTG
jgi:hypothetical protein